MQAIEQRMNTSSVHGPAPKQRGHNATITISIGPWAGYCLGSIMVGNRSWMPPPRQFQPMFQVSSSNQTAMLHQVAKIQLDMTQ